MSTFVKIIANDSRKPAGKLADAEIHFAGGDLDGLKLVGFAVWARSDGKGENVTFPARQYTVGNDRRSFVLLRAIEDPAAQERLRDLIVRAFQAHATNELNGTQSPDA